MTIFDKFSDEQFNAWLAGFFDGEGCVYIPKTPGIEISIANTNREIIEAIYQRTSAGVIMEVTYEQENWKTKYHWRIRTYSECDRILRLIRPFLTIKAEKADEALTLCAKYISRLKRNDERNQQIIQTAKDNPSLKHREIAEMFGLCRAYITTILSGGMSRRKPRRRKSFISAKERHIKNKVNPKTNTKIVP